MNPARRVSEAGGPGGAMNIFSQSGRGPPNG